MVDNSVEILSDITIHMKYARYIKEIGRRETWYELVTRNKDMHIRKFPHLSEEIEAAYRFVYAKKVLPSMRSLQFGGKPIEISPNRVYNCAYMPVDDYRAFSEAIFLLLGGTGVGYSVQRHHVDKLPAIRKPRMDRKKRFLIGDSIEGWADAIKFLMRSYFEGLSTPEFDYSDIRQKGAPLITSGGKAPGPQPLKDCIHNVTKILDAKNDGDKLTTLECHDIMCFLADAVLAGGIRRAALISLFSFDDEEMATCKYGNWWELNPQRGRANNSAVALRHRITEKEFLNLWEKIKNSGSGEPGIYFSNDKDWGVNPCCFSKRFDVMVHTKNGMKEIKSLTDQDEVWLALHNTYAQTTGYFDAGSQDVYKVSYGNGEFYVTLNHKFMMHTGTHDVAWDLVELKDIKAGDKLIGEDGELYPITSIELYAKNEPVGCIEVPEYKYFTANGILSGNCEIGLRPYQFCNLTEINANDIVDQKDFNDRAKAASFIGTLQSSYTNFHYLRDVWRRTTERDALLGIGITGICSGAILNLDETEAATLAVRENERVAALLGINKAARITTIKPSGTSSLVLGCSSGIHGWHDKYYIRRIRVGKNEAIYKYMIENHPLLVEDDYFKPSIQAVISVPQQAPSRAIYRTESVTALLERIKRFNTNWVRAGHNDGSNTHNVSATVSIKDDEWDIVGKWMWENRDYYNGLSVLPFDGGTYIQAPFESITKEQYLDLSRGLGSIDLTQVIEEDDFTDHKGEVACGSGGCELT